MTRAWLVVVGVALAVAVGHADDDPAVAVDRALDRLRQALTAVPDDGGAGEVDDAIDQLEELEALYDRLADAGGDAARRGKAGLAQLGRAREALDALAEVKAKQDALIKLPAECAQVAKAFADGLVKLEAKPAPANLAALERAADKLAQTYAPKLKAADALRADVNTARTRVTVPSGGDLKPALAIAAARAEAGQARFAKTFQATQEDCGDLARGADSPTVIAALKRMTEALGDQDATIDGLVAAYARYEVMINALRAPHAQDLQQVMRKLCELDEVGDTTALDTKPVEEVLARARDRLAKQGATVEAEATRLAAAIAKLMPSVAVGSPDHKRLTELKRKLKQRQESVEKALRDTPLARGTNHPKIRARLELGKQMHLQFQKARCKLAEVELDGSRIDCIRGCTVIEIKPDSPRAMARGADQVKRYREAILYEWKAHGATAPFTSKFPGMALECLRDGKLELKTQVETYRHCPKDVGDLEFGETLVVE